MQRGLEGLRVLIGEDIPTDVGAAIRREGGHLVTSRTSERPSVLVTNSRRIALASPLIPWVHSSWQGVDQLVAGGWPQSIRLTRTVGDIPTRIAEYVATAHAAQVLGFPEYARRQQDGLWRQELDRPARSTRGCLVVGTGPIGLAVAEKMTGLGYECIGTNRSGLADGEFAAVHPFEDLPKVLPAALVVVALPLNGNTAGLLGRDFLSRLREAHLVNVGRAQTIRTIDLESALDSMNLSRVTLDVLETEPPQNDDPLWCDPRVFVTPHIAGKTYPEDIVDSLLLARRGKGSIVEVAEANLIL